MEPIGDIEGALIAGPDSLYFVPSDELEKFRLPDELASGAREVLAGLQVPEDEVAGFALQPDFQSFQSAPLGGNLQFFPSVFGPLGRAEGGGKLFKPTKVG